MLVSRRVDSPLHPWGGQGVCGLWQLRAVQSNIPMSLEQWKKGPWLFRVYKKIKNYPVIWGLFHKPKDPYQTTRIQWKVRDPCFLDRGSLGWWLDIQWWKRMEVWTQKVDVVASQSVRGWLMVNFSLIKICGTFCSFRIFCLEQVWGIDILFDRYIYINAEL